MSTLERAAGEDALATADEWATPAAEPTPEPYDRETAVAAALRVVDDLDVLGDATARLDMDLLGGAQFWTEQLDLASLVTVSDRLQDLRRKLGQVEALVAGHAGKLVRGGFVDSNKGFLADGRPFEVLKGKDRKAWDHDRWQADVRRQVLSGVSSTLVDPESGEAVDVGALLVGVESAHGAGPPRVGVLKRQLGLDPDDYSETVPGPWSIRVYGTAGADE